MKKLLFSFFLLLSFSTVIYASFPITEDKTIIESSINQPEESAPKIDWGLFAACLLVGHFGMHRFMIGDNTNGTIMLACRVIPFLILLITSISITSAPVLAGILLGISIGGFIWGAIDLIAILRGKMSRSAKQKAKHAAALSSFESFTKEMQLQREKAREKLGIKIRPYHRYMK